MKQKKINPNPDIPNHETSLAHVHLGVVIKVIVMPISGAQWKKKQDKQDKSELARPGAASRNSQKRKQNIACYRSLVTFQGLSQTPSSQNANKEGGGVIEKQEHRQDITGQ